MHGDGKKRILLVDDDASTRSGLSELLAAAGFQCVTAHSYAAAVEAMTAATPDMLVTDIRLEDFNGLQLVINRPRHVPAVVVTGFHDAVLQRDAEQTGALYLVKPIMPAELIAAIRRLLRLQGA
jgi:DNA-binding response OmpR family regulator